MSHHTINYQRLAIKSALYRLAEVAVDVLEGEKGMQAAEFQKKGDFPEYYLALGLLHWLRTKGIVVNDAQGPGPGSWRMADEGDQSKSLPSSGLAE